MHLLQVAETLVDIIFGASESDNIRLLAGVRESDLDLVESVTNLLDLRALLSDDGPMESLFNDNVPGLLVFLK